MNPLLPPSYLIITRKGIEATVAAPVVQSVYLLSKRGAAADSFATLAGAGTDRIVGRRLRVTAFALSDRVK